MKDPTLLLCPSTRSRKAPDFSNIHRPCYGERRGRENAFLGSSVGADVAYLVHTYYSIFVHTPCYPSNVAFPSATNVHRFQALRFPSSEFGDKKKKNVAISTTDLRSEPKSSIRNDQGSIRVVVKDGIAKWPTLSRPCIRVAHCQW